MKEFNNKFKENMNEIFKNLSMEKAIVRLIIAWLFIVILELARTRKNFVSASYAGIDMVCPRTDSYWKMPTDVP